MIWAQLAPLRPSFFSVPFPFTLPQQHQSVCLQNILSSFTAWGPLLLLSHLLENMSPSYQMDLKAFLKFPESLPETTY